MRKNLARNIHPNPNGISNHQQPRINNLKSRVTAWLENYQPGNVDHEELPYPYNSTIILAVPRDEPDKKQEESVENKGQFNSIKF